MKILLAEDGTTMRKMEVKILQQIGYDNILEAVDGAQAMEKLESEGDIQAGDFRLEYAQQVRDGCSDLDAAEPPLIKTSHF